MPSRYLTHLTLVALPMMLMHLQGQQGSVQGVMWALPLHMYQALMLHGVVGHLLTRTACQCLGMWCRTTSVLPCPGLLLSLHAVVSMAHAECEQCADLLLSNHVCLDPAAGVQDQQQLRTLVGSQEGCGAAGVIGAGHCAAGEHGHPLCDHSSYDSYLNFQTQPLAMLVQNGIDKTSVGHFVAAQREKRVLLCHTLVAHLCDVLCCAVLSAGCCVHTTPSSPPDTCSRAVVSCIHVGGQGPCQAGSTTQGRAQG